MHTGQVPGFCSSFWSQGTHCNGGGQWISVVCLNPINTSRGIDIIINYLRNDPQNSIFSGEVLSTSAFCVVNKSWINHMLSLINSSTQNWILQIVPTSYNQESSVRHVCLHSAMAINPGHMDVCFRSNLYVWMSIGSGMSRPEGGQGTQDTGHA